MARDDRRLGTFLLTNAFFRHALAQPGVTHIARADDDAVFDAGAIAPLQEALDKLTALGGPYGAEVALDSTAWVPQSIAPSATMEKVNSGVVVTVALTRDASQCASASAKAP